MLDIFATGADGLIRTAAWEPSFTDGWHGWWPIKGGTAVPGAPVTAVSRSRDKLDVFVVGTDGRVWTAAWEPAFPDGWHGWWPIGDLQVPQGSVVHAVSRAPDMLDIFATGADGLIRTAAWEPSFTDGWHGWADVTNRFTAWPSIAKSPPSTVYPPDGTECWFARTDIPQAITTKARGRDLAILELRGWLTEVEATCNAGDPDWHYILELDIGWLHVSGIDPVLFLRPGDVLGYPQPNPHIARQRSRLAAIEIEVDAWPRTDTKRGTPSKPTDWTVTLPDQCRDENGAANATWPFDPRVDVNHHQLAVGQYVRMVGSAVTDHPHETRDAFVTNMILRTGLEATLATLMATDREHAQDRLRDGAANAAKWLYIESIDSKDPGNPARWNEIHSPDYIEILEGDLRPKHDHILYQIMVCAQNGLVVGDTERASIRLDAPLDRPPNSKLACQRYVTPWTRTETVIEGPTIALNDDYATVSVAVRGDGAMGGSGKFYELYELTWVPRQPLSVVPDVYEDSSETAAAAVINAGFVPVFTGARRGPNAYVVSQSPNAGIEMERGSSVVMQLRQGSRQ